jgi:nicotinate dehydrogenase subunit B
MREGPFTRDETLVSRGSAPAAIPSGAKALTATYFWPMQTHGSMGPSCAVADVRTDRATIWTASQGTHRYRNTFAHFLGLPPDRVRLVYLDGSGCYGMNGHDDAAADAAILSQAVGRPVRVQWMRHDEHGWDPKGPPQLLDLAGVVDAEGRVLDWRTEMWLAEATKGLPNIPLLAPAAAGLGQPQGLSTGLIAQNGDPPYAVESLNVVVHWLKDAPLRPSNIRAPGKVANSFAVESFTDELAAACGQDPLAFRLAKLSNPRAVEVVQRAAAMMNWEGRPSPGPGAGDPLARGRGFSFVHYKHNESLVAIGMEVVVDRERGVIQVERVVCAHDCGLVINPDGVKAQIEGNIIQTLSRALHEEVRFDRARVTSLDWASYPIMIFSEVPRIEIALLDRRHEPPLGAGEASAAPVAAALGNAVFDATGVRLRTVPFTPERVRAALAQRGA